MAVFSYNLYIIVMARFSELMGRSILSISLYIYELPIDMVASSRKNKSRQGITIRKNQQPVSIDQSSNSHLNRTDSAHSNNVRSASNSYDTLLSRPITVLMCITVTLYQVIPRHLILQRILLLILPKSEPGQLQKN